MKKHRTRWINIIFWVVFTIIIFIDYEPIWELGDAITLAFLNLIIDCPLAFLFLYLFEGMYEKKYIKKLLNIYDDNNFTYQFTFLFSIALIAIALAFIDGSIFLWLVTGHWTNIPKTNEQNQILPIIIDGWFSANEKNDGFFNVVTTFLSEKLKVVGIKNFPIYNGLSKSQVGKIHEVYRNVPEALFSFGLFTGVRMAFKYFDKTSTLETELKHEKELSVVNEKNLRWQIKPHVLTNALTSVRMLIISNKKDEALSMLSRVFETQQYVLEKGNSNEVSIIDELDFIEKYIDRYTKITENFTYKILKNNIDPFSKIAPLLLIDLVENAIKYGDTKTPIKIFADIQKDIFIFKVQNSSSNNPDNEIHNKSGSANRIGGIGLVNMINRLDILYGENYKYKKWERDLVTGIVSSSLEIKLK
jgi:two-component system, LytTR family, sensor kinase